MTPRNAARAAGQTRYHGEPCGAGHGTERIVASGVCVTCNSERTRAYRQANAERTKQQRLDWKKNNPGKVAESLRSYQIRRRYGIGLREFAEILASQGGKCAVCRKVEKRMVVDHCHSNGAIRGILCNRCNVALGMAKDDPTRLRALVRYLEKSKMEQQV